MLIIGLGKFSYILPSLQMVICAKTVWDSWKLLEDARPVCGGGLNGAGLNGEAGAFIRHIIEGLQLIKCVNCSGAGANDVSPIGWIEF